MKLSARARYGTRLLVDLAFHQVEGPVLLKDIARRQEISLHYLQHIKTLLVVGGIVLTIRGAGGGVFLSRLPEKIRLSEVIKLLEGSIDPAECVSNPESCARSKSCVTRDIWCEIKQVIDEILESITLQDLVDRQKRKEQQGQLLYSI
jgi:Rrf2 family protein